MESYEADIRKDVPDMTMLEFKRILLGGDDFTLEIKCFQPNAVLPKELLGCLESPILGE